MIQWSFSIYKFNLYIFYKYIYIYFYFYIFICTYIKRKSYIYVYIYANMSSGIQVWFLDGALWRSFAKENESLF